MVLGGKRASSSISCPRCGANNQPTARYCQTCGTLLVAPPVQQQTWYPTPQQQPQPYYPYGPPNYWETQRTGGIDNTKIGLLLLMIGSLVSWIPFVGAIGVLVGLIGAIFIIIGREVFGSDHARNVIAAIIIFVISIGVTAVGFILVFFTTFSTAIANPGSVPMEPTSYTLVLLIGGTVFSIAELIFTYALQNSTGRALLWTAFTLGVATSIINDLLILPSISGATSFFAITATSLLSSLLAAPAAVVYGIAFYMARERIERREIPPPNPQSSPASSSPVHGNP